MEHVLLSELHRTILAQDRSAEAQIPRLGVIVNEKHSQSELDEHDARCELHAMTLHVAVVLPEKENTEKMKKNESNYKLTTKLLLL